MQITIADALASQQGVERLVTCPSGKHEDANPSASLNVEKMVWYCFSCGTGGVADGAKRPPTAQQLQDMLSGDLSPKPLPNALLDVYDAWAPSKYWCDRVGERAARRYRCGTHPETGLPTYPIHSPRGELWGVVQRSGRSEGPKYLYPSGVSVSQTLFGAHLISSRPRAVVLMEGASDVMSAYEWLPPYAVALGVYGSHVKKSQKDLIEALSPSVVILGFDDDEAGRAGSAHARESLEGSHLDCVSVRWGEAGGNDPGDADASAARQLVESAANTRR